VSVERRAYQRGKWVSNSNSSIQFDELVCEAEKFYEQSQFSCFEIREHIVSDTDIQRSTVHRLFASKSDVWREYNVQHPCSLKRSKFLASCPKTLVKSKFEKCMYMNVVVFVL
jgi:hypothetical protein